jgi:hypothetical protein
MNVMEVIGGERRVWRWPPGTHIALNKRRKMILLCLTLKNDALSGN